MATIVLADFDHFGLKYLMFKIRCRIAKTLLKRKPASNGDGHGSISKTN